MARGAAVAVRRVRVPRARRGCAALSDPQGPGPVRLPARDATQSHGRSKLAALLWGDHAEAEARAICARPCRGCAACLPHEARRCLAVAAGHVAVRPDGLEIDVLRFERLVADGTPETLEGAVGLYRGPLLQDFEACGEEFDDWLGTERRRLDEMLQQTLQRLLEHYVVTGAIDRAIQVALRLRERSCRRACTAA